MPASTALGKKPVLIAGILIILMIIPATSESSCSKMSLSKNVIRSGRITQQSLFRCSISRQKVQRSQERCFSQSRAVAAPVTGASEAEVQAALKYCSNLLL